MSETKPKCADCRTTADVHACPRPGTLPGTSLGHVWLCAGCEYLREHPDAHRTAPHRTAPAVRPRRRPIR